MPVRADPKWRGKGCQTAHRLPWRAAAIAEAAAEIGAASSGAATETRAQTGEGAAADPKVAGVLG